MEIINNWCMNCVYWDKNEKASNGKCRRYPPRAFPLGGPLGQMNSVMVVPVTNSNQWCGEHKSAMQQEKPHA